MKQRRKLIAGNWKMNGNHASVIQLLQDIKKNFVVQEGVDVAVFPSYVFLYETQQLLQDSMISWGGQNVSDKVYGAFTGEVSAMMLAEYGCNYVIIGHSERRTLYAESNQVIAQKLLRALDAGLFPILCVGESDAERTEGKTLAVVSQQLASVLEVIDHFDKIRNMVIAYEPVWAIGTGRVATSEQAQQVHAAIRQQLSHYHQQLAKEIRIVYGGSVNPTNIASLLAEPDIDGGLIGGASLNAQQFLEIIQQCHN